MRGAQVSAIGLATCAWSVLLRGLWFAPASSDQTVDLEAGGGFAAGFGVYLPAIGLSLVFLVALIAGARNPRSAAPLVVSLAVLGFAVWVLTQGHLLDYLPTLQFHLWLSIALATVGALVAATARFSALPDGQTDGGVARTTSA